MVALVLPHVFGTVPPSPPEPMSALDDNFNAIVAVFAGLVTGTPVVTLNAQTGASYTFLATDSGKLVTGTNAGAIAWTLPQAVGAFNAPWFTYAACLSSSTGAITITPTGSTIDGATTLVLQPGAGAMIVSDGTNYQIERYFSPPTKAQMQAGTSAVNTVTPQRMKDHDGVAKALVSFTGATGVIIGPAGGASVNVTSITRNAAGDYTVNFTTAFADALYVPSVIGLTAAPAANAFLTPFVDTIAAGTCRIKFFRNTAAGVVDTDPTTVYFAAWGRQ